MLDEYKKAQRDGLKIHSERTISECMTFVKNEKGKPEAQGDCHDDTVMAGAIAIQMHKLCPMSRPISAEEQKKRRRRQREEARPGSEVTGW
jgi:hypothetical protein